MTKEDQKYYEQQIQMFLHPGWQHFTDQIRQMVEATDTLIGVEEGTLKFKQGELSIMNWVLEWPNQLKKAYEELLTEESLAEHKQDADI